MDFYDLLQNFRITDVDQKATRINHRVEDAKADIVSIQDQINYLSVVTLAMSELLAECGISKERIIRKINEIDMRDGRIDNKMKGSKNSCPGCHRTVSAKRTRCLYCGTEIERESIY